MTNEELFGEFKLSPYSTEFTNHFDSDAFYYWAGSYGIAMSEVEDLYEWILLNTDYRFF